MSEKLAIKTDDDWTKGRVDKVVRTLTPREADGGRKSSWAFYSTDDAMPAHDVISNPDLAPRILHALFLFLHSELNKRPTDGSRSSVRGVSVDRDQLTECQVANDPQPHLVPGYAVLHRSILLDGGEQIDRVAQQIVATQASESWRYSRVDMANILRHLLDNKYISPTMEADARSVLAQWDAAS